MTKEIPVKKIYKLSPDDVIHNHPDIGDIRLAKVNTFDTRGVVYSGFRLDAYDGGSGDFLTIFFKDELGTNTDAMFDLAIARFKFELKKEAE